jgi:lysozyme
MKKPIATKRPTIKRKSTSKKRTSSFSGKVWFYTLIGIFILVLLSSAYYYRNNLAYYFSFKSRHHFKDNVEDKRLSVHRNHQVLQKNDGKVIGFDVSEYQGAIDWTLVNKIEDNYPLEFVFIRATAGKDYVDRQFESNWSGAKNRTIIRGAYHYYRPNESSIEQAELFIKTVPLQEGDLPPVLDIEQLPKDQSIDRLKLGLMRWLNKVHQHYKVKPIIYTGERYYNDFLKAEFSDYSFWIANYNYNVTEIRENWLFWQFTEKAFFLGIKGNVDLNIYNGTSKMLRYQTIN